MHPSRIPAVGDGLSLSARRVYSGRKHARGLRNRRCVKYDKRHEECAEIFQGFWPFLEGTMKHFFQRLFFWILLPVIVPILNYYEGPSGSLGKPKWWSVASWKSLR